MLGATLYNLPTRHRSLKNITSLPQRECLALGKGQHLVVMNIFPHELSTEQVTKSANRDLPEAGWKLRLLLFSHLLQKEWTTCSCCHKPAVSASSSLWAYAYIRIHIHCSFMLLLVDLIVLTNYIVYCGFGCFFTDMKPWSWIWTP